MALQTKVNVQMAPAIAGMPASVVESHYTALTHIAADPITVGNFVFADTTDGNKVSAKGAGMVRGLAIYTRQYVVGSVTAENSMVIPAGKLVQVATNGKFWVVATNANAKIGDFVLASQDDGSVTTQTGNAQKASFTTTNFVVEKVLGTTAKSLVLISNQTATVVPPMAAAAG